MTLAMSIDPGRKNAVALWYEGRLVMAKLLHGQGGQVHTCLEGVQPVEELVQGLSERLDQVTIERPQIYQGAKNQVDPNDLITLGITVGALTSALAPYTNAVLHVLPATWKGQVKKDVTEHRVKKVLDDDELRAVELGNTRKTDDVWDAVGIGLWALKRSGR